MKSLTAKIKEAARGLGFDKVGIAQAGAPIHFGFYREWIGKGCNGTMGYLEMRMEERGDSSLLLPGAKSVLIGLVNYYWPDGDEEEGKNDLSIARFARGQDYHDHIPLALKKLGKEVESLSERPVPWRTFCDTSPILERDFAAQAGLGWIGKNCCLISEIGSWCFLGGLIMDLELEYDGPVENRCGDCRLCIEACPTGALIEPYLLDARRCISYLTIEHKGEIDSRFRKAIGKNQYGCDKCQEACPHNQNPPKTKWPAFQPKPN